MTSITTLLGLDPSMGAELAKAQQNGNGDSKSESKPEKMDTTPAPEPAEEKTAFEDEAELKQLKRSRQASVATFQFIAPNMLQHFAGT